MAGAQPIASLLVESAKVRRATHTAELVGTGVGTGRGGVDKDVRADAGVPSCSFLVPLLWCLSGLLKVHLARKGEVQ